jgi:hypothetical protein
MARVKYIATVDLGTTVTNHQLAFVASDADYKDEITLIKAGLLEPAGDYGNLPPYPVEVLAKADYLKSLYVTYIKSGRPRTDRIWIAADANLSALDTATLKGKPFKGGVIVSTTLNRGKRVNAN